MESKGKIKTKNFLRHLETLGKNSSDRLVDGFQKTERELLRQFTADTSDLIEHDEWGVGLENILTNIYEIGFIIDKKAIELAKDAITECKMDYKEWTFIEELVNENDLQQ
jgi:hypothetical protein